MKGLERNDLLVSFLLGQIGNVTETQRDPALIGSTALLSCPGAGVLDEKPCSRLVLLAPASS